MSALAAPNTSAEREKPRVYSQTRSAIALRVRRAKQKAEVAGVAGVTRVAEVTEVDEVAETTELAATPSTDYHNQAIAPSKVARQVRRKPGGYSQTRTAIASRKRQAEMDPEERKKMLERQAKYAALTRARRATKNQEGFETLSDAEQQKQLADEEARVIRERATEDTAQRQESEIPVERYVPRPTKRRRQSEHTTPSIDKTPTTSEDQNEEARIKQEHAAGDNTRPRGPRPTSARIRPGLARQFQPDWRRLALREVQQQTTPSTDMASTTSGIQSSLQRNDATQPTTGSEADQRSAQTHFTTQQGHKHLAVSYPHHPVLDLEPLIGDLSERDARIAALLFGLVREDHYRSGDHVEELCKLFAATRKRLDIERHVAEQKRVAFDEAERDALKYEAFVDDLEATAAGNARALLHLVRNLKDSPELARLLNDIFLPLKQRCIDEHVAASKSRDIFDKLDNSVNHNGSNAAQPT